MKFEQIINSTVGQWLCLPEIAFAVFGRSNRALALKVLSKRGEWIWETSSNLKEDAEIILTAMKTYPGAFANASDRLKDSYFFAVDAIAICHAAVRFASERVQSMLADEGVKV